MFDADNIRRIRSKLDVVDATLVSTAGEALAPLRAPGKRLGFLPNPVDFSIEKGLNHSRTDLPFDVFYACGNPARPLRTICGRDWNMNDFASALLEAVPGMRACFPGIHGTPHFTGARYQTALESAAIGLNLSRRADMLLYSSDRLAHMIGNGQAVLIERATGYDRLFADDELAFFSIARRTLPAGPKPDRRPLRGGNRSPPPAAPATTRCSASRSLRAMCWMSRSSSSMPKITRGRR